MPSTYIQRTPSGGNRKKWTWSAWIKLSDLTSVDRYLWSAYSAGNNTGYLQAYFHTDQQLTIGAWNVIYLNTTRVFRDPSAWYHIVIVMDTAQATAANRLKLYVNGVEETAFDTDNRSSISQDSDMGYNSNGVHTIGGYQSSGSAYPGYNGIMSHVHFTDGYAYTPSAFGETDSTTGEWKINTTPSVSYGTTGYWIFKDDAGITDQSPNSNNWTATGTLTPTKDCPSNVFATLNPLLDVNNSPTFSNGNTTATGSSTGTARFTGSNLCVSKGKWYYEVKVTASSSSPYVGVIDAQSNLRRNGTYFVNTASGVNDSGYAVNMSGDIYHNNSSSYATSIGSISTGDILGFAIDLDSAQRTCEIYKNGTSQRIFNLAEPSSGAYMLACISSYNQASAKAEVNFGNGYFGTTAVSSAGTNASGNGIFEYDCPSGYTALSTKGLNL